MHVGIGAWKSYLVLRYLSCFRNIGLASWGLIGFPITHKALNKLFGQPNTIVTPPTHQERLWFLLSNQRTNWSILWSPATTSDSAILFHYSLQLFDDALYQKSTSPCINSSNSRERDQVDPGWLAFTGCCYYYFSFPQTNLVQTAEARAGVMCYTTWSAGEEWLGWGRQLKEPGQYSEECLGMAGLRQTFLRLVNSSRCAGGREGCSLSALEKAPGPRPYSWSQAGGAGCPKARLQVSTLAEGGIGWREHSLLLRVSVLGSTLWAGGLTEPCRGDAQGALPCRYGPRDHGQLHSGSKQGMGVSEPQNGAMPGPAGQQRRHTAQRAAFSTSSMTSATCVLLNDASLTGVRGQLME